MMERFNQLAPREQILVVAAAVLVVLFIGWVLIWSPLHDRTSALDAAIDEKSRLVIDLRRASSLGSPTRTAPDRSSETMMLLITRTARVNGLSISRSQPDGPDALSVTFQNAPFDGLIEWLIDLQQSHGVNVTSASISGSRGTGLVDGQIFLDRS